ncbi:MerR family DNA-binding transcriptional regulator [Streptomyces sp. NPDC048612]|uniref:MerR family DNA-binding transcriptional regulator n=1 Tax=Streptomyces sp. NPDC048612 TaxID=3365579 RepID=UPI00371BE626
MRPADLGRECGVSAQAVRDYERDGFLPAAERSRSGYRMYTEVHAAALRAYLALVAGYGHAESGRIMNAVHAGEVGDALALIDRGHGRLLRRGGYPLDRIAGVVRQIRTAGGTGILAAVLDDWRRRLTVRGLAMLDASARLSHYLRLSEAVAPEGSREVGGLTGGRGPGGRGGRG